MPYREPITTGQVSLAQRLARPAVLWCASLSLVAHAVLLSSFTSQAQPGTGTRVRSVQQASALQVRMLHAANSTTQVDNEAAVAQASAWTQAEAEATSTASEPEQPQAEAQDPTVASASIDIAPSEVVNEAQVATGAPESGHNDYVPRPQLSVAPIARAPVFIEAPEGDTKAARHVGVLALYIDETGRVDHIEPVEPRMPLMYERAAQEAFKAATFSPGQMDGQTVKSRIRVEVVFDNTLLASR